MCALRSRLLLFLAALTLAASASASTTTITLAVHESRQLQILGVTAAWAIDTTIVDAALTNRGVSLFGRSAGRTRVMIIGVTGENTLEIVVEGKKSMTAAAKIPSGSLTTAESRYSGATREVQNNVSMTHEKPGRITQVNVRSVHQTSSMNGERPGTSLPVVSYGIFTGKRELTLFDRDVMHSPLTLSGTPLRGIHYLDSHWRLHAGYTAYATYQSFLVPVQRELVAGAGYAFRASARSTVTPSLFAYRGQGTVMSLLYDYKRDETAALRAELGFSNGIGGAVQFSLDDANDHARVDVRYRPRDFAVIGAGEAHGLRADANWSHGYGRGSNAAVSFSATDFGAQQERVLAASADVNQRLSDNVSLTGGASWGSFDRAGSNATRSLTVPAGVDLHFSRGSITALYRYARSGVNRGGHGGRLAARTSLGRLYLSAYADRQQNAPTLDVIFREQPELALALSELGISVTSPADLARALREHAALIELGFIEGVTVDFAPMRTQLGFEAAWLGATAARHQLRLRALHNIVEGVASHNVTTIASIAYSRRIFGATDIFAGYTYWQSERRGQNADVQRYAEIGVRQRFDGVPSLGGNGTISGTVFADEDLDGKSDGSGIAAEVDLDGANRQQTGPDGRFVFRNVSRGPHRISARVARPEAYFTTPSRIEAQAGEVVAFGVASTPARVIGRVTNDAHHGIGGVRVLLARGTRQVMATTDSEGRFTAATAPGEWDISIVPDSVPPDHALTGIDARSVMLDRDTPRTVEWQLRALRSVSGSGAPANAEILIEPLGTRARAGADGRFSIRSLPAGEITLIAGNVKRTVVLTSEPSSASVDFAIAEMTAAPAVRTIVSGETRGTMEYVVQIGAYRIRANAEETLQRARKSGVDAKLNVSGTLTIVRAGPYRTSDAAAADATRLIRAGLEAVVTPK
ncbi:MAG: SPOR domain-containing protein [Acidobacteriota bacterium]|nr:SPOR domain-containing protein [Acidobacteriota bacterium]